MKVNSCKNLSRYSFPYLSLVKSLSFILFILILFTGCSSTRMVEVPVDRIKIEYRDRIVRDTLIRNDSTIIRDRGDTVYIEKYKYLYKVRETRDTVNIMDTVTVVQPVEVVKEVNRIRNWQTVLMVLGGAFLALGIYKGVKRIKA